MPRFVVLKHDRDGRTHWDFLLETKGRLAAWSLPSPPEEQAHLTARALADHRKFYLDYEGPISGDRGSVRRWDEGLYETECRSDAEWVVILSGRRLNGRVVLQRAPDDRGDADVWRFSFTERAGEAPSRRTPDAAGGS